MITKSHKNLLFDLLTQPEFRVWRHVLFIALFIPIGLAQSFFVFAGSPEIPTSTIYGFGIGLAVTIIVFVYFNIYFLASCFLPKGEYASYVFALIISASGFVFLKYSAEYWVFSEAGIFREFNGISILDGLSNLVLYTICIASGSITILFKRWLEGNALIESLENKQLKNSIEEIRNRINPKFLYATLDYASEKVKSEPEQTSDTLFKLSELLRYQLYDCKRNEILLESDIKFIRNYLILEQQNSDNRLAFTISVRGDRNIFIRPNLFTPWIEEIIIQHPTELDVTFDIDDCLIKFECKVSKVDLSLCDFTKIEKRLELFYGSDIIISEGINSITLELKIC